MNWLIGMVLVIAGAYMLIFVGILGKGIVGRTKRMAETIGFAATRIIYAVIGGVILAFGIIGIIDRGIFG